MREFLAVLGYRLDVSIHHVEAAEAALHDGRFDAPCAEV